MNPNNDISDFKKFVLEIFSDYFLGVLDLELLKEQFVFELDFDAGPETIKFIVATYEDIKKNSNLIENMFTELGLKQITKIDCIQILAIKYSEEILYEPELATYTSGHIFHKYHPFDDENHNFYEDNPLEQLAYETLDWEDMIDDSEYDNELIKRNQDMVNLAKQILEKYKIEDYFLN